MNELSKRKGQIQNAPQKRPKIERDLQRGKKRASKTDEKRKLQKRPKIERELQRGKRASSTSEERELQKRKKSSINIYDSDDSMSVSDDSMGDSDDSMGDSDVSMGDDEEREKMMMEQRGLESRKTCKTALRGYKTSYGI